MARSERRRRRKNQTPGDALHALHRAQARGRRARLETGPLRAADQRLRSRAEGGARRQAGRGDVALRPQHPRGRRTAARPGPAAQKTRVFRPAVVRRWRMCSKVSRAPIREDRSIGTAPGCCYSRCIGLIRVRGGTMKVYMRNFWKETQGQDLVEYALAAGMVAVAAVAAMPQLSATVNTVFSKIASIIDNTVK